MPFFVPERPTRDEVLSFLAQSSSYGNLGLFVGAGFSKAVLNDTAPIALSWGELLELAARRMKVEYDSLSKEGISYPELASMMCKLHSHANGIEYSESLQFLKRQLAQLTSWYPTGSQRKKFAEALEALYPAWIITTNYDLVIESLLTGKSVSLGPNDSLSAPRNLVPVYHLHGARTNPEDIIIAQEDYVALFRPSQYRQIKLALTIKESTTLLIGYGLGDVNVLTALDWSRNVFSHEQQNYPNDVIQVLRKSSPQDEPYRDQNGIVILETADLSSFFDEFVTARTKLAAVEAVESKQLKKLAAKLTDPDDSLVTKFVDNEKFRRDLLKILSRFSVHLSGGFISFLDRCIDETWSRSAPRGAFEGYKQNLEILLDILSAFDMKNFPPALFQATAFALERVGCFVGSGAGRSWAAQTLWNNRKGELSDGIVRELRDVARQYAYTEIERLLDTIPA